MSRKVIGSGTNLKKPPMSVKGSTIAKTRTIATFIKRSLFGLLWKNGTVLVLITKITSDCVNKDSTNQAV
jgi:hypothetical protein